MNDNKEEKYYAGVDNPYSENEPKPAIWDVMKYVPHSLVNSNIGKLEDLKKYIDGFQIIIPSSST